MTPVGIAQLKSHLSEYVRRAQAGDTVEVLDRDRPVAHLVPVPAGGAGLTIRPPTANWADVTASLKLDPPCLVASDSVAWLIEDRQQER